MEENLKSFAPDLNSKMGHTFYQSDNQSDWANQLPGGKDNKFKIKYKCKDTLSLVNDVD